MFDRPSEPASEFRWRVEVGDSAVLSALSYALPAVFGGVCVLAALLLGGVVFAAARAGEFGRAVAAAAPVLLALLTYRWFLPAVAQTTLLDPLFGRYSRRGVVGASVVGAAVLYASFLLHPLTPFALFVASWIPFVLVAGFPTEGLADPDEGVLVVDGDRIPLAAVRSHRALPLGRFVVCWVSYARGVPSAPRTLVVPRGEFGRIRPLLDGGADETADASPVGTAQRRILVAFGVGCLAIGPVLWALFPAEAALVALYAGATFGVFGLVFLWYAVTG